MAKLESEVELAEVEAEDNLPEVEVEAEMPSEYNWEISLDMHADKADMFKAVDPTKKQGPLPAPMCS